MIEQTRRKIDSVFNDIRISTGFAVNSKLIQEFTIADDDYKGRSTALPMLWI